MTFKVVGTGPGPGENFCHSYDELWQAAYYAAKLADQGARGVRVLDEAGNEADLANAPLPPNWRRGPFKRSDFP